MATRRHLSTTTRPRRASMMTPTPTYCHPFWPSTTTGVWNDTHTSDWNAAVTIGFAVQISVALG